MTPGPELDALVAERVMGWTALYRDGQTECFKGDSGALGDNFIAGREHVPPYSTDIAAAWEVVEWFVAREWVINLSRDESRGLWEFNAYRDAPATAEGEARTAQEAICRAALAAVGHPLD